MVEIKIEKKKRPVWPWILLLVILALIGWAIYEYMNDRNMIGLQADPDTTGMTATELVKPLQHTTHDSEMKLT